VTYQSDFTLPSELLEQIASQGFEAVPELIRIVIKAVLSTWGSRPSMRILPEVGSITPLSKRTVVILPAPL
jgi:hypothetical protein